MNVPENNAIVPELVELLQQISDLLNGTRLIPDLSRIVLDYARPVCGTLKFLKTYGDAVIVRFIVDDLFGISLHARLEFNHDGFGCDYIWDDSDCTCPHKYMQISWENSIKRSDRFELGDIIKFPDIWRYAALGLDMSVIPDDELTPSVVDGGTLDIYGKHCIAPGLREMVRRLMHDIWFGKSWSEGYVVYVDR